MKKVIYLNYTATELKKEWMSMWSKPNTVKTLIYVA